MTMNFENYRAAVKRGKRAIQNSGQETLPALDDLLKDCETAGEVPLGLIDIPSDRIVGTKTAGRSTAFAPNFMPVLEEGSEFSSKWVYLYNSHLSEGIREPIRAYEYMNYYYVQEGNKRVSVLKFCNADTIPGYVTRILPVRNNDHETKLYYEYLDFYNSTNANYMFFSKEGSYYQLMEFAGKRKYDRWSLEERMDLRSAYVRFSQVFDTLGGQELQITAADAMLTYIDLFGYRQLCSETPAQIEINLRKMWNEILLLDNNKEVDVKLDPLPVEEPKRNFFNRILTPVKEVPNYKIAFIHAKTAETSSWTYSHELGRMYLKDKFSDTISTVCYDNVSGTEEALQTIEKAIQDGCEIIFTTTPEFMEASLKAAINHPEVKILNCSLNASHKYIRTYYGRMYEAKFLNGVLAGILTESNRIGYIADYPIYGMTANINAFAMGVKMVNPKAVIYLEWSTTLKNLGFNLTEKFLGKGVDLISNQDMIIPKKASRQFGLYRINGKRPVNLAIPVWHWGKYYERIVRSISSGIWNREGREEGEKALNYWWGMSASVIDLIWAPGIEYSTRKLLETLRNAICNCELNPFCGIIKDQTGAEHGAHDSELPLSEIITMDWLCDNIDGRIPAIHELKQEAQAVVRLGGTNKEEPSDEHHGNS